LILTKVRNEKLLFQDLFRSVTREEKRVFSFYDKISVWSNADMTSCDPFQV